MTITLCHICANIPFALYFTREVDNDPSLRDGFISASENALDLGTLEEIRTRSCAFCRLVDQTSTWPWRNVPVNHKLKARTSDEPAEVLRCWLYSYSFASDDTAIRAGEKPLSAYRMRIQTRYWNGSGREGRFIGDVDIQQLATDVANIPETLLGRSMSPLRVNINMVRQWLRICEERHGRSCQQYPVSHGPVPTPTQPQDLYVVDVDRLCVSKLPAGGRYIALSYCWPPEEVFMTTRKNLTQLRSPGGLEQYMGSVPSSIQDAIACVRELGESFLWVDSLCILQDDEDHKEEQIAQMSFVYNSAVMTIACVWTGYSQAGGGLPGYRTRPRLIQQQEEVVQGLHLAVALPCLEDVLLQSRYRSRAWTYQEEILSKRVLYCTDVQWYFACSKSVFCEDTIGEDVTPSIVIYPFTSLWNNLDHNGPPIASNQGIRQALYAKHFKGASQSSLNMLDQYLMRDMSDDSDILNAFEGVMFVMKKILRTHFWYGLPEAFFHRSLLWTPSRRTVRRDAPVRRRNSLLGSRRFPTWSWTRWKFTHIEHVMFTNNVQPVAHFLIINDHRQALPLYCNDPALEDLAKESSACKEGVMPPLESPTITQFIEDFQLVPRFTKTHSLPDFPETGEPETQWRAGSPRIDRGYQFSDMSGSEWKYPQCLAVWTMTAEFYVTAESIPLDDQPYNRPVRVRSKHGAWVGAVVLDANVTPNTVEGVNSFIVLSRDVRYSRERLVSFFDDTLLQELEELPVLNVMLIREQGNFTERRGVGVIYEDSWSQSNPIARLFFLT